ncbi:MAG: glycosyltransferase family 4 protein [Candidatus Omnitrophica bacterium]|nr:glycosyltransferase family 4 protein [Candidatus Omnitrophota bacterium]MDD5553126.1 glycosyltransferase family 4 protein [Candidatus Omnitrophota bacterium]
MAARKMKKLSIAHIHWGFPPVIGGVETHLSMLLPLFAKWGHRVSLLTGSSDGFKPRYVYKGARIHRTPLMDLNWLFHRGICGLNDKIREIMHTFFRQAKPDIIHAHNLNYFSKTHAQILSDFAIENKIPLILTAHNSWDDIQFLELTKDIRWSHIIAVSHFIRKEIMGIGIDHRRVTTVHHGIDTEFFRPDVNPRRVLVKHPILRKKKIIFHPARIGLAKGCDIGVKALRLIKDRFPDALLVMAGSKNIIDWGAVQQKDVAYILELIRSLKLQKDVLIDVFNLSEIAQIYTLSKLCIYPSSFSEPFGLCMLESFSSAKPIIVTNVGGMPEIVQDGINGFVIKSRDFEQLGFLAMRLLGDGDFCGRLGAAGRQMVLEHFRMERMARDNLAVYYNSLLK